MSDDEDPTPRERPVLAVDAKPAGIVLRLGGELDLYNVGQVREALAAAAEDRPARVVVDLSRVTFLDSTALGVLVEARAALPEGALRLAAPQLETTRALKVSGLDRHLRVDDTVEDALAD